MGKDRKLETYFRSREGEVGGGMGSGNGEGAKVWEANVGRFYTITTQLE